MNGTQLDPARLARFITEMWRHDGEKSAVVTALEQFIVIPNLSSAFDPDWHDNPHLDAAASHCADAAKMLARLWEARGIHTRDVVVDLVGGVESPLFDEDGKRRTPFLWVEFPAFGGYAGRDTVLFYGHLDKQPEMLPWSSGKGPRIPVIEDGKLYGRGGADDGYALFSALTALAALREQNIPHARAVVVIEAAEESGSLDIEFYLGMLRDRLGEVTLVACLDSGAGNYDQLWLTSSLRGVLNGVLEVDVLTNAVHSGDASGIVPSPVRILRALLSRLEDETTGGILPEFLQAAIPPNVRAEAARTAEVLGDELVRGFPFRTDAVRPVTDDVAELVLNRSWRPQLSVTGMAGLSEPEAAGNIVPASVAAKLSLRLPPGVDGDAAAAGLRTLLEENPPYGADVRFTLESAQAGWQAVHRAAWLEGAVAEASRTYFENDAVMLGEGGTIGFMTLFAEQFPGAEFFVIGVLGPGSNAHAADEALDLRMAARIAMCAAHVAAAHGGREE